MQIIRETWDALGTTGQAALCGALTGPLLSLLQTAWTHLKLPGVWPDSTWLRKRVISIGLACIPAAIAAAGTGQWAPVLAAGIVAWFAGQGTHAVTKARAATGADDSEQLRQANGGD